ncbi:peptidyl-prolyl cis-trans isomerase [Puniceibacterium sediminis]|uniref:Peptidyl-prolyl cis-trans isomerase D n=1 Tax=Puniceibacterium sediminis TaxID=1608407 RepID=A0A238XHA5_9RHOB|nr:peptidyl-prolyl cis-trans isomerase [Puniceibacterium sediminis]SNR57961.1 peptidyl-prolyl cis-trans isomerase D [Puniceibacterium sediminis]
MAFKARNLSKTFVWIILLLLMVGLAGFGATNLSGTARSIGSVGDKKISIDAYGRALQNELRAIEAQTGSPMPFAQAEQLGLSQQVLAQLVTSKAFDYEAGQLGLSVGDEQLAQSLGQISAFQGVNGQFDREAYRFALRNAGLTETAFEEEMRDETARTILQGAVLAGTTLPDTYVDTLLAYVGQKRAFTYATLDQSSLETGLPVPTDEELKAYYDANADQYMRPETKVITYAWITPAMILDTVDVDEDALRAAYEERSTHYNTPERRLVERLVFSDDAAAQEAKASIDAGETDFETLVAERGLDLADIDLGDVTLGALGAAGEDIFIAAPGTLVGPLPSSLGPALFRVNGVLPAQVIPFDEARDQLNDELALDRARRVVETQAQGYDDELAGGATLEQLASDTEMQLGQIEWAGEAGDGIAGYDAFREAAQAVQDGDFPVIEPLGDGGVFALRLDEVLPEAPLPLEDVIDRVRTGWDREKATESLTEAAEMLVDQVGDGQTFTDLGLNTTTEAGLTRDARVTDLPPGLLSAVFEMEPAQIRVLPGNGQVTLVRLDEVIAVDPEAEESKALADQLREQAANDVAQDLFRALSADIQTRAGVQINQQALNAVHTQIP